MGSAKTTYDPQLRKTEHGSRLYAYWKRIHRDSDSPEFQTFPSFFNWAMSNEYTLGAKLMKYDEFEPFGPDNCFWLAKCECVGIGHGLGATIDRNLTWERKWDETVNRIREHFGMEPIHSEEV